MTSTLFAGGKLLRLPGAASWDWLKVDGECVVAAGTGDHRPQADRTVDLDGATLIPAFCDAHVHLPATGLYVAGMDFRGVGSADQILRAFSDKARGSEGVLFGGNFEDPLDRPLSRHDLDRSVGDRPALLARADMHSCIVSTALLGKLPIDGLEGVDVDSDKSPTGYLREQAASEAWAWFDRTMTPAQQRTTVFAAAESAYARGVASVHEMFVVEWRGWDSLDTFMSIIKDVSLEVVVYPGTLDVQRVLDLGLNRVGGDLFLDGSFGSHTAWLAEPYSSAPPAGSPPLGISYRSDADLHDFFIAAQSARIQTGVHAIGDAAIEQAIAGWEKVAELCGLDAVRALGHRIEHFECAGDDHIRRAAVLGLRASVQPAFDAYWGGPDGLYASRIGWERASQMNRFNSMMLAGLTLGAGSDSTVTPLDPFLQLASLRDHHIESESLGAIEALRLHTTGAHALAHGPSLRGTLEVGAPASLAILDIDPATASVDRLGETHVLGTWVQGVRVWPPSEAEAA